MANPQKEKGFVGIAYDLFEQFFIRDFSVLQLKMLLLIVRFSYGFGKKVAKIKPQRLFELAYIYRCDIKEELKFLKQNKVIKYNLELGEIQLNKNFDEWKIPYHKLFNEDDLIRLKKINLDAKKLAKEFGYPDEVTPEDVCAEQTEVFADNKQISEQNTSQIEECLPITNKVVCAEQTEVFADNKQENAGNSSASVNTNTPIYKDIEVIENTNIYISNNEEVISKPIPKIDPYINPYKKKFTEEYKKIFHNDCYLNNMQHTKLVEIAAEVPNFLELIPVLVLKFSKITFNFDGVKKKPGLRWLLEEGNWAGVLSGEFDAQIEGEQEGRKQNDGYNY